MNYRIENPISFWTWNVVLIWPLSKHLLVCLSLNFRLFSSVIIQTKESNYLSDKPIIFISLCMYNCTHLFILFCLLVKVKLLWLKFQFLYTRNCSNCMRIIILRFSKKCVEYNTLFSVIYALLWVYYIFVIFCLVEIKKKVVNQ